MIVIEESIHIANDTDSGVKVLCGIEAAFAVYPSELAHIPEEAICASCRERLRRGNQPADDPDAAERGKTASR
jgi:hypothetical protein